VTDIERQAALDVIGAEVAACTRCRLHQGRTRAVPGEGTAGTEVVFVGEGPGVNEDRQGRPFVGQAGSLLDDLLASVLWSRDEVFITNVVKCRPPGNRDPEPDEIAACAPYLTRQLEALDPALVVTLGRFSMARFSPGARIGQVHGTFHAADIASGAPRALTFCMYHPAAALHQGSLKQTLFTDMLGVPAALTEARAVRATAVPAPEPLSAVPAPEPPSAVPAPEPLSAVPAPEPPSAVPAPEPLSVPATDPHSAAPAPEPASVPATDPVAETAPEASSRAGSSHDGPASDSVPLRVPEALVQPPSEEFETTTPADAEFDPASQLALF
jgi:DNA polymerase